MLAVELHKNCYCSFTSKDNIKKFVAKKRKTDSIDVEEAFAPVASRIRRLQVTEFDQCLFCAEECKPVDYRHPGRWDRVVQCERKGVKGAPDFKAVVLQYCGDRNDVWSREVSLRCHGVHDLAAAEAQYHIRCYDEFRKIPVEDDQTSPIDDKPMQMLVYGTSIELHDKYVSYGGQLTRKQMFTKLVKHMGDDIVVLCIDGCASIVGFREFVGKTLKIAKVDTVDEEEEDTLVRRITNEARGIPFSKNYDLGDFTHAKTKEKTSATLLRFVSKLISHGEVTKASLSLSQSIQYCITNMQNQTTLGLGVELHHKFGSRDLIDNLHQHGYTVSYDEVLRFRKSAAKYVSDNTATLHQMMGFTRGAGLIFGWYDNFDLLVSTPNGRRETHAMATQFQSHPAGIIEFGSAQPGISTLTIPRLTSKQAKLVGRNRAIPLLHYTGPKKVSPPAASTSKTTGISYTDLCTRQASLETAQEKDAQWLNSLSQGQDAMEWNGFNNQLARSQGILKPASPYMFGPLIDAPPSHQYYNPISSPIKTMYALKKKTKGNLRPIIDLENIFLRLLMIGQKQQMELGPLFAYELCAVPSSLIDGHGCLRKSNKSDLVKRLGVLETLPMAPEIVIIDVSQLFYHMVWPHGGSPSNLIASIQSYLGRYPNDTDKIVVFDKYNTLSAKDHERMRHAGEVMLDYELSITTSLPKRDAILKSNNNKRRLASVLSTFSTGENVTMETRDDGVFDHDEADVTMVSYSQGC